VLIIVFTNVIGALLYLLIGRPRNRTTGRPDSPSGGGDVPNGGALPPPPGTS
jgi:hypothetical protein